MQNNSQQARNDGGSSKLDVYEYVTILQYALAIVISVFIGFYVMVPSTIKKIIIARLFRQRVALGFISNDSGFTYLDRLRQVEDKGHKLGLFIGDKAGYVVTPRPTSDIKTREIIGERPFLDDDGNQKLDADKNPLMEEYTIEEEYFSVGLEDKQAIDEIIQKKHIMDFGGVPVYFGYIGKAFACCPALLDAMEKTDRNIKDKTFYSISLNDPRSIKKYIPWTLNPNIIDAIEWKAEQVGYLGRPPSETLKKMVFPVMILLILFVVGYIAAKYFGYI